MLLDVLPKAGVRVRELYVPLCERQQWKPPVTRNFKTFTVLDEDKMEIPDGIS
jgi:hypothetical protein